MASEQLIAAAAARHGLPLEILRAVVQHESKGDPLAVGDGGSALGLMQVHRAAAEDVGMDWDALKALIDAGDSDNAALMGMEIGSRYLAKLGAQFLHVWAWALAAYNQGPSVIQRAKTYAEVVLTLARQA